ncbi:MAG: DUF2924 domain-containing protein [Rubrivivax sp.]|nr:MAG: DUF2924 domain-containing protein [Rubrivivax sp.]
MASGDLDAELDALAVMSSAQLREHWSAVTGRPVPQVSPKLLRLALAWELQARVRGGLSRRTSQKLAQLAGAKTVTRDVRPGMRLVREWGGRLHVVTVSEDGVICWNERERHPLVESCLLGAEEQEGGGMNRVRCAIYTRKSSEEGLEQDFNSLDAQREACAAYVLSQASEGWQQLADHYDDGGISGGTLERPALQRLLADIEAGRIDIVVVYKVDRLSRSLFDFARLVEVFEKAGVSFVSVTQSFNTTTSMGRLTLNMLLSFAQFEREVTAERIRDKIAASTAKGMWMGGVPPLGYRPHGRSLAIVDEHAALVRDIFARYFALGNVRRVANALAADGVRRPLRTTSGGRSYGGGPFTRGPLYPMLRNATYAGRIPHRDKCYPGNHPPIIDPGWCQSNAKLSPLGGVWSLNVAA